MVAKPTAQLTQRTEVNHHSAGHLATRGYSLPSLAAAVSIIAGSMVLVGWIANNDPLRSLLHTDAVKVNTAMGLILLGAGTYLARIPQRRRLGMALLVAACLIGAATLVEYATGFNLGIDQAILPDRQHLYGIGLPGRMSPLTAAAFILIGSAAAVSAVRPATSLLVAGGVTVALGLATLNLFNLLLGGAPPAFLAGSTQMPAAVALIVVVLALGVLASLDDRGPLGILRGQSTASMLARRMLLAAIVLPTALAWLRVRGEALGLYDSRFGASLMLVVTILCLAVVIVGAAVAGRQLERQREALQNERDRFFDLSLDMLATASPEGVFIRLNPAWEATLGYPTHELTAKPFLEFVHPDDREATVYETNRQFAEGKTVLHFQNRYRHRDGTYRWLEWTSQPAADGSVVYAVARDITMRKLEEERITRQTASLTTRNERLADRAVRDPLTGLHNRAYLETAVARLEARRRRGDESALVAAIMFDLDHFGQFNKQHGHQAGDAILRHFAQLLRHRFRGGDVIARFGGEEFVVLLDGATRDTAFQAAEQIRSRLESAPIDFDGVELRATVSAGCAELNKGMGIAELLTTADVGLSQAKRAGRNMVVAA